tara:strand:- start:1618 stop:2676 length:1059 start_codon:yes stop_codon:yes gene_type:complete
MGVPASGQINLASIYNECAGVTYASSKFGNDISLQGISNNTSTGMVTTHINKAMMPHNRPDASAPHAMSEFYSYDVDDDLPGLLCDDWEDGQISGTRHTFHQTGHQLAEDGDLDSAELDVSFVHTSAGTTRNARPTWTANPGGTGFNPTSTALRLINSTSPYGGWYKTTDSTAFTSFGIPLAGALTATDQALAFRWRFKMNSTNNKDAVVDVRMNTTNLSTNPGISTQTYQIQVADNLDPATGKVQLRRRSGTSVTTLATTPSGTYTIGTTMDFVFSVHESAFGTRTLKVAVGPTTESTPGLIDGYNEISVTDTTYSTMRGWTFRCPKFMSTPTSTHFHEFEYIYGTVVDEM